LQTPIRPQESRRGRLLSGQVRETLALVTRVPAEPY
jgi:hypothetical protein